MIVRISIILPFFGIILAGIWMFTSGFQVSHRSMAISPAVSPYRESIAAAGIIEGSNGNYNLAPPIPGILRTIYVAENQIVRKGEPLYQIDDSEQRAILQRADASVVRSRAMIDVCNAQIESQMANVKAVTATIESAKAAYEDSAQVADRTMLMFKEKLVAEEQHISALKAREANKARWDQALAQEKQAEAVLRSSQAQLVQLRAELDEAVATRNQNAVLLEKLTVKSPADGKVLQVNSRLGEYVSSTPTTAPVILGDTDSMLVLADVNESDAYRVTPVISATASLKGYPSRTFPLRFQRVIPFVVPKKNLTGSNFERTDVRVLQIEFRFTPPAFPVYVGQQVDVFIEAGTPGRK